jgi:N-acetylglucosaminyldiphosphoundecaprenol N-acetyl-beta-D-mannosaminyltransferase
MKIAQSSPKISVEVGQPPLRDMEEHQRLSVEILGVRIDLVDYESALGLMKKSISQHSLGKYICACPVHPIMVSQRDQEIRHALNTSWLNVPDGMPVVWAARLLGASISNNVRGTDLMLRCCEMAARHNYSVFLYGGKQVTLEKLETNLQKRFPGLRIAGAYSPPFRPLTSDEETKIVEMLNLASPDFLFVGLGAPKQEKWMADHCHKIKVPVTLGVGAAFDFLSEEKKQAPAWMQARGLEWLFRLLSEPTRLWVRYGIYNPLFVFSFLGQLVRTKLRLKMDEEIDNK